MPLKNNKQVHVFLLYQEFSTQLQAVVLSLESLVGNSLASVLANQTGLYAFILGWDSNFTVWYSWVKDCTIGHIQLMSWEVLLYTIIKKPFQMNFMK